MGQTFHRRNLGVALITLSLGITTAGAQRLPPQPSAATPACGTSATNTITFSRIPHSFQPVANSVLFRIDHLMMDLDGAPTTYGFRDQGIDGICNGLASYKAAPICRSNVRAPGCYDACHQALKDWNTQKRTPEAAKQAFCSVGLGSGCGPTFSVALQSPATEVNGYFVSSTSLHYREPAGQSRSAWLQTQDSQLDALRIPYFSLPPQMRSNYGIELGDVGAIVRTDRPDQPPVFFIMGDGGSGKSIGEVSGYVRQRLSLLPALPMRMETSAFSEQVDRVVAPSPPPVAVAVFPHTNLLVPGTKSLVDLMPDTIGGWIETRAKSALAELGGAERLLACAPKWQ